MNAASERHDSGETMADGDPIYQKNPHPTQAYRITMTIEDAPGPFEWVTGTAFYEMTNHKQCTPIEPIAGVWSKSKEDGIPIHFKKINESTYVATIYADGMVDSDCLDSTSKRNTLSASRVYACQKAMFTSVQKNAQSCRLKRDEARACAQSPGFWIEVRRP